jgi:ABC-2 type transport system ATP-binding protein
VSAAAAALGSHAGVDADALTVSMPYDGDVAQVRSLLARLEGIEVTTFAVHTPDLDDVFLALTGHTTTETHEPQEALR